MEDGKTSAGILMQTHCSVLPMRANPRTLGVKCNGFPVYKKTDFHSKSSFFVLGFWRNLQFIWSWLVRKLSQTC